jgi:purine-nucleoside phosphorylase
MNRFDPAIAKQYLIASGFSETVNAAVILGSGLGGFASTVTNVKSIPYSEIPGFPEVTVSGHGGELLQGEVGSSTVLVFSGRFHHYEGHPLDRTVIPVVLASAFGARNLIVSNAAGSINTRFSVGDLMLIDDFMRIGFKSSTGTEPARSRYDNREEIKLAHRVGLDLGIQLRQGTYLFVKGPVYETAAEIRAFRYLGADAVGMSTVPELLEAHKLGMRSLGITLITNMSTGVTKAKLEHGEIKEVADSRKDDFSRLVKEILQRL